MVNHEFSERLILGISIGVLIMVVRWLASTPEQQWPLIGLAALAVTVVQALLLARRAEHPERRAERPERPPAAPAERERWRNSPFARELNQSWTGLAPTSAPVLPDEQSADRRAPLPSQCDMV